MDKLKLLGIGKSEKHNYYIFSKRQKFFEIIRELLKWLKFKKYDWDAFGRPIDKKFKEPIFSKEDNIKTYTDEKYIFEKEEYYIEIIFGKDNVFLMIHTEKDRQQKLSKFLNQFIEE